MPASSIRRSSRAVSNGMAGDFAAVTIGGSLDGCCLSGDFRGNPGARHASNQRTGHDEKSGENALDLQYSTEQIILRDTAENFLRDHYDYKSYQRAITGEPGFSEELWSAFSRLGWLGLPFATEDGGSGGDAVETAILMEAFGRALVIDPCIPTVILGGGLVAALGSSDERAELLAPLIDGKSRLALAHQDRGGATTATATAQGFSLTGAKALVVGATAADTLLVTAELEARSRGSRLGVFVVKRSAPGLVVRPVRMIDGRDAAALALADVALPSRALVDDNDD